MKARDLTAHDAEWPSGFDDLGRSFFPSAPRVRGTLPTGARPGVAIVGARVASQQALAFAYDLAFELAMEGVVVWSGGALGIDAAAHRGALAGSGATIAVLGGGLHHPSPPENLELFESIVASGGALLSPYEDDHLALPQGFLYRNRVLAAASQALVVVQCEIKSGARSAAAAARRLRRPVGVVPHAPWDLFGAGNQLELTRHRALPVVGSIDVLRILGLEPRCRAAGEESSEGSTEPPIPPAVGRVEDPLAREIYALLARGPQHVDALGHSTGRSAAETARAVFELAVEGLAVEIGAGTWKVAV